MQGLTSFFTTPGVTALLGVVLGVVLKGIFDVFGEGRRLKHEAQERQEQRAHEIAMQKEEDRDRRRRAYARFLGTAHTVGQPKTPEIKQRGRRTMIEPTPATDPPLGAPRGVGLPAEGESRVRKTKHTYEDYEEFGQWLEPFNVFDAPRALAEELSSWFGAALTRSSPA